MGNNFLMSQLGATVFLLQYTLLCRVLSKDSLSHINFVYGVLQPQAFHCSSLPTFRSVIRIMKAAFMVSLNKHVCNSLKVTHSHSSLVPLHLLLYLLNMPSFLPGEVLVTVQDSAQAMVLHEICCSQ